MSTQTPQAGGHITAISYDNHLMTETAPTPDTAASAVRRALAAPLTKRAWAELGYTVTSFLLTVAAVTFIVPMLENGVFYTTAQGRVDPGLPGALGRDIWGEGACHTSMRRGYGARQRCRGAVGDTRRIRAVSEWR